jgi:Domain of unknown function (DUF4202)
LPLYRTFCDKTIAVTKNFQPVDAERFARAWRLFDEENSGDPTTVQTASGPAPRELVYARWLTDWVLRLNPSASEELRLAARSQHLCRWKIPRNSYPQTRAGYLKWREVLKKFHADKAAEILRQSGYPETVIARVRDLNLKKDFPRDPETRVLEDALCLVFLEHQFSDLARKTSDEKMIGALRKAWKKMTPPAQALALKLPFQGREKDLLANALREKR